MSGRAIRSDLPMSGRSHLGYAGDPDLFVMEVIVR